MGLILFGVLLVAAREKIAHSLSLSVLVDDRRSGHICVLVWFCLGILVFNLISFLCGIPDCLSSDCFWSHP